MSTESPEDRFEICDARRSILDRDEHMLIVGGPGSGKTTIALLKARRAVLNSLRPEQKVLFLSFSNSAIRRILESSGNVLSPEVADQVEIKTYHSFAWDILKSHGYLISNQRRLCIIPAQDAAVRSAGIEKSDWEAEQERLFLEEGLVAYDRFAPRASEILLRSSAARSLFCGAYPIILVDEFQDTDDDQWALVKALSEGSTIVALGDREQRIYGWRDGVSEHRLAEFENDLHPFTVDFRNENNRSPATGIAGYARGLLSPETNQDLPADIQQRYFQPPMFDVALRVSLLHTWQQTSKRTSGSSFNVAIAARSKTMVRKISDSLDKQMTIQGILHSPVPHDVLLDQNQIVLAARVISNVLGSSVDAREDRLAQTLARVGDMLRASNKSTNISKSDTLRKWAVKCSDLKPPNTKCVVALQRIFDELDRSGFVGSPTEDWISVRRKFEESDVDELVRTGDFARYLRLLRRGSVIEEQLASLWRSTGTYVGAEEALERAILQDQIASDATEKARISVMNMHQLKGREYDGVLLVEDRHRTFRAHENAPPYADTRRLLQVALTRARSYAAILSQRRYGTLDVLNQ